jgi:phosphotransferase system  glucose/maltose/N-acetylglucosamine-specific IIC component
MDGRKVKAYSLLILGIALSAFIGYVLYNLWPKDWGRVPGYAIAKTLTFIYFPFYYWLCQKYPDYFRFWSTQEVTPIENRVPAKKKFIFWLIFFVVGLIGVLILMPLSAIILHEMGIGKWEDRYQIWLGVLALIYLIIFVIITMRFYPKNSLEIADLTEPEIKNQPQNTTKNFVCKSCGARNYHSLCEFCGNKTG